MSTPEDKLTAAAAKVTADLAKVKAWYVDHRFYGGLAVGIVVALIARHFL